MRQSKLSLMGLALLMASASGCCLLDCLQSWRKPQADRDRAGHPEQVSSCAHPSDTGRYIGYQVGGGAPCKGDGPCVEDGTWGWDYPGYCLPSIVDLGWWHGQREQGGAGAYRTDGPRVIQTIKERHEE